MPSITQQLNSFDFTDLALLVGTNPLPNFITANFFLKNNLNLQRIWLIHSEDRPEWGQRGTWKDAEAICKLLKSRANQSEKIEFFYVPLSNVGSARQIKADLEKRLFKNVLFQTKIHLNYTGGTKAMAVHVYRHMEEQYQDNITFSYLDARNCVLKMDSDRIWENISPDLRDEVGIRLEDLIQLHGYQKLSSKCMDDWGVANQIIEEKIINAGRIDSYLNWQKKFVRNYFKDEKAKWICTTNKYLKRLGVLDEQDRRIDCICEKMRQQFRRDTPDTIIEAAQALKNPTFVDEKGELWIPEPKTSNNEFKARIEHPLKGFFEGKWLEAFVQSLIERNIKSEPDLREKYEKGLIDLQGNWEIQKSDGKMFELDVIVVNGYQICGISVTTSDEEETVKLKCFEILHRVRQIGGEEARAVMVSCLTKERAEEVAAEMKITTGSEQDFLLVIAKEELPAEVLWPKLREHIWRNLE
jgi:hypothetical protein